MIRWMFWKERDYIVREVVKQKYRFDYNYIPEHGLVEHHFESLDFKFSVTRVPAQGGGMRHDSHELLIKYEKSSTLVPYAITRRDAIYLYRHLIKAHIEREDMGNKIMNACALSEYVTNKEKDE